MSQTFPTEFLEAVVDCVAQGPCVGSAPALLSLCLSCKALVPCCQKYLFHTVTLYPPLEEPASQDLPSYPTRLKRYQRTLACLRTLTERPHLAAHVEKLVCSFDGEHLSSDSAILSAAKLAFKQMIAIRSLTVGHDDFGQPDGRLDFLRPPISGSGWAEAIAGRLLEGTHLKRVAIHNITHYPSQALFRCSKLEHLELANAKIGFGFRGISFTPFASGVPRLKSVICDQNSFSHLRVAVSDFMVGLVPAGKASPINPAYIILSRVEVLHLDMGLFREVRGDGLLNKAGNLKVLTLSLDFILGRQCDCPLNHLKLTSFGTLTHLTLNLLQTLPKDLAVGDDEVYTPLPYGCAWKESLMKLANLESVVIRLTFQDHFNISPASFGPQWGDMPDIFEHPSNFSNLKQIQFILCIHICGQEDEPEWWSTVGGKTAREFHRSLEDIVYPRHFLPLMRRLNAGGDVDVSFEIETSFGDRL